MIMRVATENHCYVPYRFHSALIQIAPQATFQLFDTWYMMYLFQGIELQNQLMRMSEWVSEWMLSGEDI